MRTFKLLPVVLLLFLAGSLEAQNKKDKKIMKDAVKAKKTLLKTSPGLERFFDNSAGYVIFPNVGKGGLIIGGASGNGVVYLQGGEAIGMADLKKINVGFQAGGQSIIEAIFFETEVDLDRFKEGKFAFEASVSAVALKSGVAANAKYVDGVAVFALPKAGLMADASVGGQKFGYSSF